MPVISDDSRVKTEFIFAGDVISLLVTLCTLPIIALFFSQRLRTMRMKQLTTVASGTVLVAYGTSFIFIFVVTVLLHVRHDMRRAPADLCNATTLTCILLRSLFTGSQLLFFIERAYVVSWPVNPRWRTPEYVISCIVILGSYLTVTILAMVYDNSLATVVSNDYGICMNSTETFAMVSLIVIEFVAYIYLALRFLIPVLTSHVCGRGLLLPLRGLVWRTFLGIGITALSNLAVRVTFILFQKEPAWLCCLTCKVNAFIAVCALHWITKANKVVEKPAPQPPILGVGFEKDDSGMEYS